MRSDIYDVLAEEARTHWWFQARERILIDFMAARAAELFPHGTESRILDVGAGVGQISAAMRRFGRVTALEGAPEALPHLKAVEGITVLSGILPNPDIERGSFELVTAFDVLEHIDDDIQAAADIHDVLVSGGHFLMTVPAHPLLWSDHDTAHHHFRRYRPREAEDLLRGAGFEVVAASPFQCFLFPLLVVERLVRRVVRRGPDASARLDVPAAPLNAALRGVFESERGFVSRGWRLPVGSSHLVLGRRS